jgi:hypothetical protein
VDPIVSRKNWRALEPVHAQVYFSPENFEEYAALGYDVKANPLAGYFPARAAAMGAVNAATVQATFFNFSEIAVVFGMDKAWEIATPEQLIAARYRGVDRTLRRLCGDLLDSPDVERAVELARTATEGCTPYGRPLYAGNAALEWPDTPHLQLFHAVTLLREFRGDGHIAALVSEGVTGLQAAIMHVAQGDAWTREPLRKTRVYTSEQWDEACVVLRERGWLDESDQFTETGAAVRQRIEDQTDVLALPPWEHLGEEGCEQLRALVRPLSKAIVDGGGVKIR